MLGLVWVVCYRVAMRLHISLDKEIVADLDARIGRRRRSAFIAEALRQALDERRRWDEIEAALGAIPDSGHEWDQDPAAWVRSQRRSDVEAVG
jgi:Arc/MetJ family transcription regulator